VFDKNFNLKDELYLKLIPDDGIYHVTPDGMAVNKIDLVKLAEEAITYKEAGTALYKFLQWNRADCDEPLIPLGHNVRDDVLGLRGVIVSEGSWDNFVTRRPLDTMYIARFYQMIGKLPVDSISLGNLMKYFGIEVEGELHDAKTDTLGSVKLYQKLVELAGVIK
jgi:hypothetical protein